MYIFYDKITDYLEALQSKGPNYAEALKRGIIVFKSEKDDHVIGYGIQEISKRIDKLDLFSPYEKLSILIKITRIKRGFTQKQMARKMGIKLLPYQRLESGKNNPTLKTIIKLREFLPEIELSIVA